MYFESPGRAAREHARAVPGGARTAAAGAGSSPMSATTTCPAWKRPGATTSPSFGPWKVTVRSASHGGSGHLARRGVDPRGEVDRDHGLPARVDPLDRRGRLGPGRAAEARAEEGVDHDVGARGVVRLDAPRALLAQDRAPRSARRRRSRRRRRRPRSAARRGRARSASAATARARALHQLAGRLRVAGIALLGGAHLRGGEERLVHRGQAGAAARGDRGRPRRSPPPPCASASARRRARASRRARQSAASSRRASRPASAGRRSRSPST